LDVVVGWRKEYAKGIGVMVRRRRSIGRRDGAVVVAFVAFVIRWCFIFSIVCQLEAEEISLVLLRHTVGWDVFCSSFGGGKDGK